MPRPRRPARSTPPPPPARGPEERAEQLLERLESDGPGPQRAAEELDRLQPALERAGELERVRGRVRTLCLEWTQQPLRGERADAWLVLVGGFGLREQAGRVRGMLLDGGLPARMRTRGCDTLAALDPASAGTTFLELLRSGGDTQVRVAAAAAAAGLRDRSLREPLLQLLEEPLPPAVWRAVSEAAERSG